MHIIFDLDGTLLDTEFEISKISAALAAEKGCKISAEEIFINFSGLGAVAKCAGIAAWCGVKLSASEIEEMAHRHEEEKAKRNLAGSPASSVIAGVPEMLDSLEKAGHVLSLASSNMSAFSKAALDKTGLRHHFNERVYGPDNVGGKRKPDPAVYLHAIAAQPRMTGIPIVVEDSVPGITAGHAAGAFVIARLDPRFGSGTVAAAQTEAFKKAGANVVISDYADLERSLPRQYKNHRCKHNIKPSTL